MLATFWQCCLTNPWQLGWMPQEQWLSGEIKITRNYCEQDFLIFPIRCINIFYHFLPFTIIYCAVYCWWQPFRFRSWSRCSPRRTCLNFLVDFQRERRRRRQRENIQKKKVWTVWTTIYISLYIIYIIIYLYNILENIQTRYGDVWRCMEYYDDGVKSDTHWLESASCFRLRGGAYSCMPADIYACTILHMFSSGHVERETSVQRQQVHEHAILVLTLQVPVSHPARVPCPYCLSHLPRHKCLDSANIRKVS